MRTMIALLIVVLLALTVSWAEPPAPVVSCPICQKPIKPGEFTAGQVTESGEIKPCHFRHAFENAWNDRTEQLQRKYGEE
jgi:hypothetical protein